MTIKDIFYFVYLFKVTVCSLEAMMEKRPSKEALKAFSCFFFSSEVVEC